MSEVQVVRRCIDCDHFRPMGTWRPLDALLDNTRLFVLSGGCAHPRNIRRRGKVLLWRSVREDDFCSDFTATECSDPLFDSEDFDPNEEDDTDAKTEEEDCRQLGLFVRQDALPVRD